MCYKKWGGVVGNFFGHMRRTTLNRYCMSRSGGNFVGNEEEQADLTPRCIFYRSSRIECSNNNFKSFKPEVNNIGSSLLYYMTIGKKKQRDGGVNKLVCDEKVLES